VPAHQSWMYDADPFAAKKSVADRQEKAAKKKEKTQQTANSPAPKSEWGIFDGSPEVKLSTELRGLVENAIKTVVILSPFIRMCLLLMLVLGDRRQSR
jgi:ATP-dependent RNA helicase DHX57